MMNTNPAKQSPTPKPKKHHPWKSFANIKSAKKSGDLRRRRALYAQDVKDPLYRQAMTANHNRWERAKYHNDPEWREKRLQYYAAKYRKAVKPVTTE